MGMWIAIICGLMVLGAAAYVALGHFGSSHLRVGAVGEHEEQVSVEAALDALAHVLDVGQ